MSDPYLYEEIPVLKNKLDIRVEETLALVEAELSRANMMLLYEQGFHDFSPDGLRFIHQELFGDIYDWAGQYRIINIEKRERLLAGRSVWYSNDEDIPHDLQIIFQEMKAVSWTELSHLDFVQQITHFFPRLWQVHPFREGNTRTIVMLMTFFVEHYGSLLAGSPHPSASRPPSPSGKAFFVVASTFIISYYPARFSIIRTATGTDSRQSTTPPSKAKGALTPSAEWNGKPRLLSTAIRIAAAT